MSRTFPLYEWGEVASGGAHPVIGFGWMRSDPGRSGQALPTRMDGEAPGPGLFSPYLNREVRMLSMLRSRRPSHATVVAYLALFIALGGSSYAALKVTSRNVPKDALTGADIKNLTGKDVRNNSLTGADVRNLGSGDVANGKLLAEDFAPGQLPAGPQGVQGPQGEKGEKGDEGDPGEQGEPATKLWAVVGPNINVIPPTAFIARGSGIVSATRDSEGDYDLTFDRSVATCAWVGNSGLAPPPQGAISVFETRANVAVSDSGGDPARLRVSVRQHDGTDVDSSFHLAVFC